MPSPTATRRDWLRDLELLLALLCCLLNLLLLAVPLVGLTFLPSLFASAAWAASANRPPSTPR